VPLSLEQLLGNWQADFSRRIEDRRKSHDTTSDIWEERPVTVDRFVLDKEYLGLRGTVYDVIVEDLVDLLDGWERLQPKYDVAVFNEAIGTGKSFKLSICAIYIAYVLLCLRFPQVAMGLAPGSRLAIMNVAVTANQARDVVYGRIYNTVVASPWFMDRFPPNDEKGSRLEFDPTPRKRRQREQKGWFKNITILPGSSSEYSAVGYDLVCGIIDEASLFKQIDRSMKTDEGEHDMNQAEIIFDTFSSRLKSRFWAKGHPAILVLGGSPQYQDDFLEKKCSEARIKPRMFVRRRSHWDVHHSKWSGKAFYFDLRNLCVLSTEKEQEALAKGELHREDIFLRVPDLYRNDFEERGGAALRNLGGRPTKAVHRFFSRPYVVEERCNFERENPLESTFIFKEWFGPISSGPHTIHVDLALNKCAAALCMAHMSGLSPTGEPLVFVDLIMRFVKEDFAEGEIIFDDIRGIILQLVEMGFNLELITYDGWQSIDSIQQLIYRYDLNAEEFSVDRTPAPYYNLKRLIIKDQIDYYDSTRDDQEGTGIPTVVSELQSLEEVMEGNRTKIQKPAKQTKDMADAMCGAANNILRYPPLQRTAEEDFETKSF
jgi:hypothetical protein